VSLSRPKVGKDVEKVVRAGGFPSNGSQIDVGTWTNKGGISPAYGRPTTGGFMPSPPMRCVEAARLATNF